MDVLSMLPHTDTPLPADNPMMLQGNFSTVGDRRLRRRNWR
jgi:hypothetical protein